jgi:hypothetical protein
VCEVGNNLKFVVDFVQVLNVEINSEMDQPTTTVVRSSWKTELKATVPTKLLSNIVVRRQVSSDTAAHSPNIVIFRSQPSN